MSRLTGGISMLGTIFAVCAAFAGTFDLAVAPAGGRYFAGERLRRTVVCTDVGERIVCRWATALIGDQVVEASSVELTPADGTATGEFVTTIPQVNQRLPSTLALRVYVGEKVVAEREFHESIFPKEPVTLDTERGEGSSVGLFDPSGETARVLTDMKVPFVLLSSSLGLQAFSGDLIILGEGPTLLQAPAGLLAADARAHQGLAVIVLTQQEWPTDRFRPHWLPPPVEGAGSRGAEPLSTQQELTQDLEPGDLTNWRVPSAAGREGTWESATWRALALPGRGNVRNHLGAENGRASVSFLFEYLPGEGRVLVTTLPVVSAYDSEPVARILMRNLLLLATAPRPEWKRTVLWGNPEGKPLAWLRERGLRGPVNRVGLADADVVVIDGSSALSETFPKAKGEVVKGLERFVRRGGIALILGMTRETLDDYRSLLPAGLSLRKMRLREFTVDREAPLLWGVPQQALSTLRTTLANLALPEFEPGPKARALTEPPMVSRFTLGEGTVIVVQLPFWELRDEHEAPYVLAQILTNLGVRLAEPGEPGGKEERTRPLR